MGCPVHNVDWKTIPAGISKKTGKAYGAFQVCPFQDCKERPEAPLDQLEPLDAKILESKVDEALERDKERTRLIQRQHSQDMAIQTMDLWLKVQISDTAEMTKENLLESIKKLTDYYMEDLNE